MGPFDPILMEVSLHGSRNIEESGRCRLQGLLSRGWISRGLTTLGAPVSPKRQTPWIVSRSNPPFLRGPSLLLRETLWKLAGVSHGYVIAWPKLRALTVSLKYASLRCLSSSISPPFLLSLIHGEGELNAYDRTKNIRKNTINLSYMMMFEK